MADRLAAFPLSSHPLNDHFDSTVAPPGLRSGHTQRYTAPIQTQQRSLYRAEPNEQQGPPTPVSGSTGPSGGRNANALSDSVNVLSNGGYQVPDDSTGMCATRSSMDTVSYERLEQGLLQQSRDAHDDLRSQSRIALRDPATERSPGLHKDNGQPRRQLSTGARTHRWPFMDEPEESYIQAQGVAPEMSRTNDRGPAGSASRECRPSSAKQWWKSLWTPGGTPSNGTRRSQDSTRRAVDEGVQIDSSITKPQNLRQGERSVVRGAAADYYDEAQSFATQHYEHAVPGQAQDLSRPDLAPVELQPDSGSNPAQSSAGPASIAAMLKGYTYVGGDVVDRMKQSDGRCSSIKRAQSKQILDCWRSDEMCDGSLG
ncbi:hypothetical protein LTR56_015628 [Elasticomyces elasticus]|nr:hypothetical protein LTR56_015628 [Elasticomyces elasticus]KAK3652555.1 hypothetical protein LTR22_011642 [Elasticomyces elasticus]KAK4919261.1 hypothetical protein LTR49_013108 [Elasticomyces elasticus]KAK5757818.1 hypothetical protein LTS12_012136 [Elasticomyces elasticus]